MESVLLVIHIIVCVALVGVILLQQNSSDGLSGIGGGGSSGSLMSSRGSANFLTRLTAILATLFIVNSLVLAVLASHSKRGDSPVDSILPAAEQKAPLAPNDNTPKNTKAQVPLAK